MCSCKNWKHGWSLSCNLAVNRISREKFLFKITLFQLAVLLQKARNKNIEKQHFFIQQNCSLKLKYFKPICLKLKQIPKQFFKEKNLQFFISFSPGSTLNFRNKLPHLLHYKTSYKYKQLKTKSETDLKFTACKYKTKNSFRTTCEVSRLIYISQTISNAKKNFFRFIRKRLGEVLLTDTHFQTGVHQRWNSFHNFIFQHTFLLSVCRF